MKIPVSIAEKLIMLLDGDKIPFSKLKHPSIELMIENGILNKQIQGRSKILLYMTDKDTLAAYLRNHHGIDNLDNYIAASRSHDLRRADAVDVSSSSKLKPIRTFRGFLVNCYQPVNCKLNNEPLTVMPLEGTFTFIYDYDRFIPSENVTIVGIENPESFRHIQKQKNLFKGIEPLFVSRYPQNKDLIRWLQSIPNRYLHFGDFDYAGLNIYFNEYQKHLKARARFFIPPDIENLLATKGNRDNYHNQIIKFDPDQIDEDGILRLLDLIKKHKKGLEQEIFSI